MRQQVPHPGPGRPRSGYLRSGGGAEVGVRGARHVRRVAAAHFHGSEDCTQVHRTPEAAAVFGRPAFTAGEGHIPSV